MTSTQIYIFLIVTSLGIILSLPVNQVEGEDWKSDDLTNTTKNTTEESPKNLYVIRAIVYEIGILTNVSDDESDTNDTITNERVDLTFFNPDKNGSVIDLDNIPLPVQTNISGHSYTGIVPMDLGSLSTSDDTLNISGLVIPDELEKLVASLPTMYITKNNDTSNNTFDLASLINLDIPIQTISQKSATY